MSDKTTKRSTVKITNPNHLPHWPTTAELRKRLAARFDAFHNLAATVDEMLDIELEASGLKSLSEQARTGAAWSRAEARAKALDKRRTVLETKLKAELLAFYTADVAAMAEGAEPGEMMRNFAGHENYTGDPLADFKVEEVISYATELLGQGKRRKMEREVAATKTDVAKAIASSKASEVANG